MNGRLNSCVKRLLGAKVQCIFYMIGIKNWINIFINGDKVRDKRAENSLSGASCEFFLRKVHGKFKKGVFWSHAHLSWRSITASGEGIYDVLQSGAAASRNWSKDPWVLWSTGRQLEGNNLIPGYSWGIASRIFPSQYSKLIRAMFFKTSSWVHKGCLGS